MCGNLVITVLSLSNVADTTLPDKRAAVKPEMAYDIVMYL